MKLRGRLLMESNRKTITSPSAPNSARSNSMSIFVIFIFSLFVYVYVYVLCFMFYVLCFMFYVLCFMFYVLCFMFYVLCFIFLTALKVELILNDHLLVMTPTGNHEGEVSTSGENRGGGREEERRC